MISGFHSGPRQTEHANLRASQLSGAGNLAASATRSDYSAICGISGKDCVGSRSTPRALGHTTSTEGNVVCARVLIASPPGSWLRRDMVRRSSEITSGRELNGLAVRFCGRWAHNNGLQHSRVLG